MVLDILRTLAWSTTYDEFGHFTGKRWLFTPIKPSYAVPMTEGKRYWYIISLMRFWQNHYLDLRVLVINLLIGFILCFILPLFLARSRRRAAWVLLILGLCYGVFLTVVYPLVARYTDGFLGAWLMLWFGSCGLGGFLIIRRQRAKMERQPVIRV